MAIDKPSLNDFLPNGFETQDKDGYKVNFDADKISAGYDKDTLEILSGPNLNNLLDNVGKNTHTLQQFLNFFRDMPIGSFPIVNTSNQLDYKSVNSFFRNVGEIVFSAIPLEDGNLRLLDGSLLEYNMTYSRFITYIAGLRSSLPNLFCTEQEFNQSVATYGVCGKFVYDTVTKSLRLPKISGFIKGTLDSGSLGDIDEAKAPNITGGFGDNIGDGAEAWGYTGAFALTNQIINTLTTTNVDRAGRKVDFNASRSSSIYKDGVTTIEPQSIKEFIYMVVSIDEAEKQVLSAVYNYKGSVPTYADLPTAVAIGEVYNVIGEDPEGYSGANFAWTGEEWDRLGGTVNLSGYLTKVEGANTYATKASLESNVDYLQQQINTNASNIANIASEEVIEQGIRKIEMLKFASTLGIGKVADTDLFAIINKMKRSSFDRSKFTVVGSPNITDDGIASGFSGSNYLTINTISSKNFKLKLPINFGSNPFNSTIYFFFTLDTNNAEFYTLRCNSGAIQLTYKNTSNTSIYWTIAENSFISANTNYLIEVETNGSNIYTKVTNLDNNISVTDSVSNFNPASYSNINLLQIGRQFTYGSIDLKQFSITVDGVEVFSGNKTGIDTIKPDNYTVVGTPTISADGIISGMSNNDYVSFSLPQTITINNTFELTIKFNIGTWSDTVVQSSAIIYGDTFPYLQFYESHLNLGGDNSTGTKVFSENEEVTLKWVRQGGTNNIYYLNTNNEFVLDYTFYNDWNFWGTVWLGNSIYPSRFMGGSIDLNAFKIYVDGDLVYQPCLKIPYTESKTGSKVTDKLDRAIDMAEQCGFSQYFGLDEQNGLCLVPQGENITGRRDLISRVEDSTTHYVTEIYSDLYCKQMGSGTASTAVTLNIPYKDEYYKLSVPQSAKSKTGFTPTASCDWTAEGYIYLDEVI